MDRKPFNIQDFKSNKETPVETRNGKAVEIKSILNEDYTYELYPVKGRVEGELYSTNDCDSWSLVGKYNNSKNINDFDLFFSNKAMETESQIKLIPFDVTKAKTYQNPDGLEVVTKNNQKVEILTTSKCGNPYHIVALIEIVDTYHNKVSDRIVSYSHEGISQFNEDDIQLFLKQPVRPRRMTNRELSWWLQEHPEEHRENKFKDGDWISATFNYNTNNAEEEVEDFILIRANGGEWKEPLIIDGDEEYK